MEIRLDFIGICQMDFPWTECMILDHEVIPLVLLSPDERSGVGFEGRVWNLLDVRVAVPVICGASNANPGFRIRHLSGATPSHFKVRVRSEHPSRALAGEVAIEEPLLILGRQPPWHYRRDQGRRISWSVGALGHRGRRRVSRRSPLCPVATGPWDRGPPCVRPPYSTVLTADSHSALRRILCQHRW